MASELPRRGRVLVADDDPAVLRGTTLVLRAAGFDVDAVETGHAAADALGKTRYDALLADINMPGNAQLELLQLREGRALVPVILITGNPSLETAVGALRHGVVDYVTKPVAPEELLVRVDAAVRKGRALHALDDARQRATALIDAVGALESAVSLVGLRDPAPRAGGGAPNPLGDPLERLPRDEFDRLSPRERDVVRLLAVGHPVQEAATALGLSTNTVRNHMKSVFAKLRVRSQVALLGKLAGHAQQDERKH
jgi:DNA-binding NarL/FixJ family response regulator